MYVTGWDMVKHDSGGTKGMLDGRRDTSHIPICVDWDWTTVVHLQKRRTNILSYSMSIETPWDLTILYVPPHWRFRRHVRSLSHLHRSQISFPHRIHDRQMKLSIRVKDFGRQ